ncbi:MAG TPA: hypothetical protein VJZ04_08115 [Lachnospiraceae bacterium]|nr:hypothetical protein [Lachnospiraceae bacterium]
MKKIKIIAPFILSGILLLTGCGASIPELTEEQNQLITEYAAGLLLKYDKNQHSMLVDTSIVENSDSSLESNSIEELIPETNSPEVDGNETIISDNEITMEEIQPIEMAPFLGLDGINITYTGYEVCDSYPGDLDEELFLSMDASNNKKLVVFSFDVTNISDKEKLADFLNVDSRYRFFINGGKQNNSLTTMLPNDLSTFHNMLQPNETKQLVLVIEVAPEITENITDISLVIKLSDNKQTYILQPQK